MCNTTFQYSWEQTTIFEGAVPWKYNPGRTSHQAWTHVLVVVLASQVQRCLLGVVLAIHHCTVAKQQLNHMPAAVKRGHMKRSHAILVAAFSTKLRSSTPLKFTNNIKMAEKSKHRNYALKIMQEFQDRPEQDTDEKSARIHHKKNDAPVITVLDCSHSRKELKHNRK